MVPQHEYNPRKVSGLSEPKEHSEQSEELLSVASEILEEEEAERWKEKHAARHANPLIVPYGDPDEECPEDHAIQENHSQVDSMESVFTEVSAEQMQMGSSEQEQVLLKTERSAQVAVASSAREVTSGRSSMDEYAELSQRLVLQSAIEAEKAIIEASAHMSTEPGRTAV